ncbi:FadR/GntR family transcriptional regulator [Pseudolysinimonas yzui]|uniref:FadR/GntR family transcriptional regulator n=1 Tax=Pseudolysinimonas yzui TaxID=2708254 RepID=UPI001E6350D9|nr:FadR/GntR family transcriptional regulator [Pseudolysinimonas yzui]
MTRADDAVVSALPPGLSQTDVVVQSIKAMITRGDLTAGSRLPVEKDLAEALGVSRGSLREGVRALCIMGVLETRQGDGTYVTSLDSTLLLAPMAFMVDLQGPEHRHDLHAVRRILESEAAARAAMHITDDDIAAARTLLDEMHDLVFEKAAIDHEAVLKGDLAFHRILAKASDNGALAALIDALADRTALARRTFGLQHEEQVRTAFREHEAILAAIIARDPDRARLQMSHHLLAIEDFLHDDDSLAAPAQ